uniref:Uncharacterized protein n=1 Tax=Rhodnius prolixus TaxID=13249 RepID=T1IA34_RHOPR
MEGRCYAMLLMNPFTPALQKSNLGGRVNLFLTAILKLTNISKFLMSCKQLDSRFNVGKKFVGYTWLRGGDMRQRRDYMYRPEFIAPRSPLEKQRYHQTDGVKQLPMWME